MRTRVFLNPSDNTLVGKYPPEVEHVHVVLDSSVAAFSVQLPDVTQPEHKEFIFYNYPSDGIGNAVTLVPVTGQLLINTDTSHVLQPGDTVSACADLKNRWLLTDVNKVNPFEHTRLHALDSTLDHSSTIDEGYLMKGDANGLSSQATNTDTEVAAAVSASHTRNKDSILASSDGALDAVSVDADGDVGIGDGSYEKTLILFRPTSDSAKFGINGTYPLELRSTGILSPVLAASLLPGENTKRVLYSGGSGEFSADSLFIVINNTLTDDQYVEVASLTGLKAGVIEICFKDATDSFVATFDIYTICGGVAISLIRVNGSSGQVAVADSDNYLCVYIKSGSLFIKNRLGITTVVKGYVRLNSL